MSLREYKLLLTSRFILFTQNMNCSKNSAPELKMKVRQLFLGDYVKVGFLWIGVGKED